MQASPFAMFENVKVRDFEECKILMRPISSSSKMLWLMISKQFHYCFLRCKIFLKFHDSNEMLTRKVGKSVL